MPRIVDFVQLCNDDWMLQDYLDASGPLLGPPDMYGPPSSGWDVFVVSSYARYLRFRHVDYPTFTERMVSTMVYLYGYGFTPEIMAHTLILFLYAEGAWLHCPATVVYQHIMDLFFQQTHGFTDVIIGY